MTEPLSIFSSIVMEGFKKSSFPTSPFEVIGEKFYLNSFCNFMFRNYEKFADFYPTSTLD